MSQWGFAEERTPAQKIGVMPKTLPARVARRWERIKICFMPDDYVRHFPCPLCGVKCPVPVYLVEEYAGRKVTRWCEACRQLIDLQMPPKEDASR